MTLVSRKKNSTFRSPLTDKIPFPLASAIATRQQKFAFDDYDQAFILRRSSAFCYHDSVIADFMPLQNPKSFSEQVQKNRYYQHQKLFSVYNKDCKHFTPAFVAGKDLREYIDSTPAYDLQKFKEKLQQAKVRSSQDDSKKKIKIFVPKPSSQKCQVCKIQFQDYAQHIKSQDHIKIHQQSLGWKFITDLVNDFSDKHQSQNFKKNPNQKKVRAKAKPVNNYKKCYDKETKISKRSEIQKLVNQVLVTKARFKTKLIIKPNIQIIQKKHKPGKNLVGASSTHVSLT